MCGGTREDLALDERMEQFVERMGMVTEADGLPRIAGRMFGLLLVTPGELSIDELASILSVSKASVSNDARRLVQTGVLERRSRPADRKDYYAIAPDVFQRSVEVRLENLKKFHALASEARAVAGDDPEVLHRLDAWAEAHRLLMIALERLWTEMQDSPILHREAGNP